MTDADSGNGGFKVIYQNYPGETLVISGGTQITGWTLHDSVNNIWQASVSPTLRFRQLYVNNCRAIRARTPNLTSTTFGPDGCTYATDTGAFTTTTTGMSATAPYTLGVNATELANWANLTKNELGWQAIAGEPSVFNPRKTPDVA